MDRKQIAYGDMKTFLHSGVLGTFLFVSYLCMVLGCGVLVFIGVWITVRPKNDKRVTQNAD